VRIAPKNERREDAMKKKQQFRIFAWSAALAALLQTIGLARYVSRLPDDLVGITIYTITLIAFIAASIGGFIQARKVDEI